MDAPIRMLDVERRFDDHLVVDDLSLQVTEGTIFGFVGPSGSGKTTTVRLLTGVLPPTSGAVTVLGKDPRRLRPRERERIGYMPQLGVLYPHLSVDDNLKLIASLYGIARPGRRIARALELLGLDDARDRRLRDASGGMQRRVALAGALLHEPALLFLDEPTSGLDPVLRQRVWAHLQRLRDEGRTLFVTTQIVSEATMCDRVGLIAGGRMLAEGTPDELRRAAAGGDVVDLKVREPLPADVLARLETHPTVRLLQETADDRRSVRVVVDDAAEAVPALRRVVESGGHEVVIAERYLAPFDDVFVALLEGTA